MLIPAAPPHRAPKPSLPGTGIGASPSPYLTGQSIAMQRVRAQLHHIAPYFRIALITGEVGTGKETIARVLHARSAGAVGPFIPRQAADFAAQCEVAEDRTLLDKAQGGTLFLNDIRSITHTHQALLFRLLQQLGTRRQDLRIIVATDQELRPLIATGQFREDLYQRIAAVEIGLPPLRKRPEDIACLTELLLRDLGLSAITAEASARLELYSWPRNIGELLQVIGQAAALASGSVIEAIHLSLPDSPTTSRSSSEPTIERLEDVVRRHVVAVLTRCSGNKLRTAEILGISRSTLYRMLDAGTATHEPADTARELCSVLSPPALTP